MVKNLSIVLAVVAVNAILILLYVSSSFAIANDFNSYPNDLLSVNWNPFGLIDIYHAGGLVNGNFMATGAFYLFYDFPSWIFIISTAVNLLFVILLLRRKEKPN